jgi:hypothetical protein
MILKMLLLCPPLFWFSDRGAFSVDNGNSVELISFLPLICSVYIITGLSLKLCRISYFHFVRFDSIITIRCLYNILIVMKFCAFVGLNCNNCGGYSEFSQIFVFLCLKSLVKPIRGVVMVLTESGLSN